MPNIIIDDGTRANFRTIPAQEIPTIAPDQAVSFSVSFSAVKKIVGDLRPLQRPSRTRPQNSAAIDAEIAQWESASDEAWDSIDG